MSFLNSKFANKGFYFEYYELHIKMPTSDPYERKFIYIYNVMDKYTIKNRIAINSIDVIERPLIKLLRERGLSANKVKII